MAEKAAKMAVIVMAKPPRPGAVKTRLSGLLTPEKASLIHEAMLVCVLDRARIALGDRTDLVLALAGYPQSASLLGPEVRAACTIWTLMDQAGGDLGQRIAHAWRTVGADRPAMVLGVDTPDLPADHLVSAERAMCHHEAAVGPTHDGGYWTLAGRRLRKELLTGIDWGGASVYDQTCAAAQGAAIDLAVLDRWHDVDVPDDVTALRRRLSDANEPALKKLADRLSAICGTICS